MRELLPIASAWLLAVLGFALLALNQERHLTRVCEPAPSTFRSSRTQRVLAVLAIASGLPMCISAQGAGFGSLLWAMLLPATAMSVAFILTWRPHWLRPVAAASRVLLAAVPSNSRGNDVSNPANHLP